MTFRREGGACLSSTVRKKSQYWFAAPVSGLINDLDKAMKTKSSQSLSC